MVRSVFVAQGNVLPNTWLQIRKGRKMLGQLLPQMDKVIRCNAQHFVPTAVRGTGATRIPVTRKLTLIKHKDSHEAKQADHTQRIQDHVGSYYFLFWITQYIAPSRFDGSAFSDDKNFNGSYEDKVW